MEKTNKKNSDGLLEKIRQGDKKSFQRLEKLAEDGNAQAMSNLAAIYLKGIGGFENSYEKALELFDKAAILNDTRALFCLGTFYRDAKYGFEQDGQKAAEYFIRGAQHATIPEDVSNLLNLAAEIYRYGKGGVIPDAQKVIELYEKLEELESRGEAKPESNSEKALLKLAEIYTEGCGSLKPNARKALEYLLKVDDVFALIDFYREGKAGIKPNGYEVIECLSELSFRHMKTIAEIYRDGKYNVKADGHIAIEYLIKKAECEAMASKFNFIEKYKDEPILFGDLAETNAFDDVMEYSYFEERIEEFAEFYLERSVDYEHNNATEYCSEAREICNVDVFQEIAKIYLEGKGGFQPDGYKALEYFSKAAEGINRIIDFTKNFIENNSEIIKKRSGTFRRVFRWLARINKNIYEKIAEIYSEGKAGVQPDGHKAIEYLLKAIEAVNAERDNPDEDSKESISAIYNKIAWIYLEGCGDVQTDGYKAIDYFEKSSNFERIAEIYRDGKAGVEPDPQKAIEYFLKHESTIHHPKNSNHEMSEFDTFLDNEERASAFRKIAEIYYSLNDGQKALEYFLKADKFGDEWAYINVAGIYREGKGNLKPDGVKLVEYLTKKLEQLESPDSIILYDIAKAHEEGCGSLEPNTQKALEFYRKAAALGNDFAKEELAIRKLL